MTHPNRVRLLVEIDGVPYLVRRSAEGPIVLHKADGTAYRVRLGDGGDRTCDCPDFTYRRPEAGCKHVRALRETRLIDDDTNGDGRRCDRCSTPNSRPPSSP